MSDKSHITFEDAKCVRESGSGRALLVDINGEEHWIPKSLIHDDSEVYKPNTEGTLVIPTWFAEKEGIE